MIGSGATLMVIVVGAVGVGLVPGALAAFFLPGASMVKAGLASLAVGLGFFLYDQKHPVGQWAVGTPALVAYTALGLGASFLLIGIPKAIYY